MTYPFESQKVVRNPQKMCIFHAKRSRFHREFGLEMIDEWHWLLVINRRHRRSPTLTWGRDNRWWWWEWGRAGRWARQVLSAATRPTSSRTTRASSAAGNSAVKHTNTYEFNNCRRL